METKKTQCHPQLVVNATCLLGEKGCYKNGKCHYIGNCEHKVLTHADRIRAMSDEELVRMLGHNSICDYVQDHSGKHCEKHGSCDGCLVEWLKQPVEE